MRKLTCVVLAAVAVAACGSDTNQVWTPPIVTGQPSSPVTEERMRIVAPIETPTQVEVSALGVTLPVVSAPIGSKTEVDGCGEATQLTWGRYLVTSRDCDDGFGNLAANLHVGDEVTITFDTDRTYTVSKVIEVDETDYPRWLWADPAEYVLMTDSDTPGFKYQALLVTFDPDYDENGD